MRSVHPQMHPGHRLVPAAVLPALLLLGCGYAGEPKPPALMRPMQIAGLEAVERGSRIVVSFYLPWETTEGIPINGPPDVELRVGVVPNPWNEDEWRASAERVPVPQPRGANVASGAVGARATAPSASGGSPVRGAQGTSGAIAGSGAGTPKKSILALAKGLSKPPPQVSVVPSKASLFRTVSIDASKFSGKTVVIGALVHGPKGRDEGWSIVQMEVLPTLPVPGKLQGTDIPGAVHLQWTADAPEFLVFRKQPADQDWVQVGDSMQSSWDDTSFAYGKTWQYYVQSVRRSGNRRMESDASETFTFTPVDRFPPAVPAGLVVISGTRTIELVWDRVADGDLAGYRIYRNGVRIADALVTPAYSDKEVSLGSRYRYEVSAVDQAGNESARSTAVEILME